LSGVKREHIVVVGAGGAGLRAAERLRELNFDGELTIVSEEPYRPYHRPMLSKQLLNGSVRPRDIVLPVHTELDAVWRFATRATRLEPDEHILHLPGGEEIKYDGLVIATGVQARHLPGAPRHDPRVQVLRTVSDAVAVQRAIAHSRGVVAAIGGGFVACEVASAARELGRDATIITRERELLDRVPGTNIREKVTDLHDAAGVQVLTETTVKHWVPRPDGMALHLSTGQVVVAAVVVLGVGTVAGADWLRGSGLIVDDGIMCRSTCHAIGASEVVVAGDIARWPNLRFDSMPRRVEHWLNAIEMGRAAAENLLVGEQASKPFTPVPRFWSDQHGVRIQAAGLPAIAERTVQLGGSSVTVGNRVTGYVSDGALIGLTAWDSPRAMLRHTAELTSQTDVSMRRREASRDSARKVAAVAHAEPVVPADPPTEPIPVVEPAAPKPDSRFAELPPVASIPAVERTEQIAPIAPPVPAAPPRDVRPPIPVRPPAAARTEATPAVRATAPPPAAVERTEWIPVVPPVAAQPTVPMARPTVKPPAPVSRPAAPASRPAAKPAMPKARPAMPATPPASAPKTEHIPVVARPTAKPAVPATVPPATTPKTEHVPAMAQLNNRPAAQRHAEPAKPAQPATPRRRANNAGRDNNKNVPAMARIDQQPSGRRDAEHPSFPSMRPVTRPGASTSRPTEIRKLPTNHTEHPSFPAMRPVDKPANGYPEHPSFPSMRPVSRDTALPPRPAASRRSDQPARPPAPRRSRRAEDKPAAPQANRYTEHPSFPSMRPVSRDDGSEQQPRQPVTRYTEHPSFPSMRPVDPAFAAFVEEMDVPSLRVPDLPPIDLRAVIR
jgi:NADPH-dependent 2,4-dienoyl-CoA reductase/sulfur reductase-like enzyme